MKNYDVVTCNVCYVWAFNYYMMKGLSTSCGMRPPNKIFKINRAISKCYKLEVPCILWVSDPIPKRLIGQEYVQCVCFFLFVLFCFFFLFMSLKIVVWLSPCLALYQFYSVFIVNRFYTNDLIFAMLFCSKVILMSLKLVVCLSPCLALYQFFCVHSEPILHQWPHFCYTVLLQI